LLAVFVTGPLGADSRALGTMMSAQAVGGVAGSVLSSRLARRCRPVPLIAASYACFGVIDVAIFYSPRVGAGVWPVVALFGLAGVPVGVHVPVIWALFQRTTPDALRGRAFAAIWTGATVAGVVGAALAGWLGGTVDVRTLLTVQGVGPILAAALFGLIAGAAPETRTPGPPAVPLTRSAARCDGGVSTDPPTPRSTP
jgi:predicted MFS family arabinose efflux permease